MAPAERQLPEARTTRRCLMAKERILQNAVSDEVRRTVLRESLDRYRNELLDDEERLVLHDRIIALKKKLASLAAS